MTMNALMRMGGSGGGEANGLMQLVRGGGQPQPSQGGDVVGAVNRYLDQNNSQRTDAEIMQAIQAVTGYPISKQEFMDHVMGGRPLEDIVRGGSDPSEGRGLPVPGQQATPLRTSPATERAMYWSGRAYAHDPMGRGVADDDHNNALLRLPHERAGQTRDEHLFGPDWRYDTGPR